MSAPDAAAAADSSPRVLLVTPPFTQLNTPYPATTYLTGTLRRRGFAVRQVDLSIETALRLFSAAGLARAFAVLRANGAADATTERFLDLEASYRTTIDRVIAFLQGRDPTLASRIVHGDLLPRGPRFVSSQLDLDWAFGALGVQERARFLATLYLYDLADLVQQGITPHFGLARYGESLATSAASFDPLAAALAAPPSLIDELIAEAMLAALAAGTPGLVGFTVPFPGNLYGALRAAQALRRAHPSLKIALGGGYVNTELRDLDEPRLFDLVDYVTLDDGERPLLALLDHLAGRRPEARLARTFLRRHGRVVFVDGAGESDLAQGEQGTPTYEGLPIDRYLSVIELANPMHRLWSDGRWSKLTVAHGCYWKKCTFCDVSLDYISRYQPLAAPALADRMVALIAETGQSGFHFVDEAAPPLVLIDLALELLRRGLVVSWWGNIRFEKTFTPEVCRLLVASGCIAVSGGLEVASDRLLALIEKGVTVAQVARVTSAFAAAGALVHAYLMYGFPTETAQETIDSLERVRQLFVAGAIDSAFWHRFVLTRHAPIARDPGRYQLRVVSPRGGRFASNDLVHEDPAGCDPARFSDGLRAAVLNYMHGIGLDRPVTSWFSDRVPKPAVPKDLVARALAEREEADPAREGGRLVWVGGTVRVAPRRAAVTVVARSAEEQIPLPSSAIAGWVGELIARASPGGRGDTPYPRLPDLAASFPGGAARFARLRLSPAWQALGAAGLLTIP